MRKVPQPFGAVAEMLLANDELDERPPARASRSERLRR
jgi:hypothetical protein